MTREELSDLIDELVDQIDTAIDNEECEDGIEYVRDELKELSHGLTER